MEAQRKRQLLDKDRAYVWHPFTQMKDYEHQDHLLIERADNVFLYDTDGNRYYDTISSWWVNTHGHGHPAIKAAIAEQLGRIDHIQFSGLTHEPGIELAEKLVKICPPGLSKAFYSDNGSTAVEVGLKMSFQYWRQSGKPGKTKFIFMENSYHGDTIGAVSVGGVEEFHAMFRPLLFASYKVRSPHPYHPERGERSEAEWVDACLAEVRDLLERASEEIAGFVIEPMIQAAGGMIHYPAAYVAGVRRLCDEFGIHMIADEVAVGFGRTGRMFGCEHAGVSPDILATSKGLTAGVIPLSATVCTEEIYGGFYDDYSSGKTFTHGHSFTGNPIAAAVALANIRIFEEDRVLEHVGHAAAVLAEEVAGFSRHPHVGRIRSLGMTAAFELLRDPERGTPFDGSERMGNRVYRAGLKEGLILRPLDDVMYYWLPLCTTEEQIRDIAARTHRVLERLDL